MPIPKTCITSNTPCEYRPVDRKRVPVSHEYVASLESRISWLETFVQSLRAATPEQREEMLNSTAAEMEGKDHPSPRSSKQAQEETQTDEADRASSSASIPGDYISHLGIHFFRWQYPHFMFIYREAFLCDHFSKDDGDGDDRSRKHRKYWSPALLLSICALGALVNLETKATSERFFLAAESIIMVTGLTRPSVATVQAFLCLALYEIGRGNLSKGWGYSDLGLQRNPKDWVHHNSSLATPEDVEIRRRIYWGCYISDKLISLILGRPVYLVYDDAEVQPMETLPEPPEMNLWRPVGFDEEYRESAKASSMISYLHEQIRLSRIIERMVSTLFSPRSNLDDLGRRVCFDNLNLDLNRWRESLPDFARWPSAIASRECDADEKPQSYCVTSARHTTSLVRTYRSQYGLQHAPLVFVYGAVQASRSAKAFNITEESQYLIQMLGELSSAWSLSREVMAKVLDC
ncbi:fungal-specific transcription factor domain-containing protein [Colletotrichum phormii]|uniref:Fungal-specific transcription factor domain-containing protein n=1 Tax=Colletotrichum phormii TaxID=359342 RepID=A0AAI9ZIC0_9PEZI|nr:fungal-specific transcription factor domain-containing protein [Colletotrichum phormii]KAK1624793.1 fungal-specific transcription factor domain-containing protein [Colletotrichum phormii]